MTDWNYDVEAAPKQTPVIVTTKNLKSGVTASGESFRSSSGNWHCEDWWAVCVIAWMPFPDPAPLPEAHAKEERE